MNRDGAQKSIWQFIADYSPVNTWAPAKVYDVLIVGGGITGLTTALLLQEKGLKCVIAEAHNIGFGTSGGTTAHLNTLLDTPYKKLTADFGQGGAVLAAKGARTAIELIETLDIKYGINCDLSYKNAYLFAETTEEADELEKIQDANMAAGLDSAWTSTIPVPIPFEKAIKVEMQGQMHPARYLQGLAGAYEKLGGVLLQDCRVTNVTQDGVLHAETSLGEIRAEKIVYATHVPPGITLFSFRCAPYRSYAMAFTLKDPEGYPDALVYDSRDPYHYFRSHVINGKKHMIAGGNDHKTGHNANTAHIFTELEAYVRRYFDIDEVAAKWSSQYYESADGLPYIGLMPGYNDTYVATGFGGNGMIWGSLSGKILCDMIVGNTSLYHDLFSPSRIKPIAGFASFVKENADVIGQFIGRRFAYEHISQLAELAPGQAKIAELEGRKIALYKDERGVLHALDPVCPHAGCIVTWNSAERSWDCPCHGARYSPDGDLLTGPARHNLATVEWSNL